MLRPGLNETAVELATALMIAGELGDVVGDMHRNLGKAMAEARPKAIFWKGAYLEQIREGLDLGDWSGEVLEIGDDESFRQQAAQLNLEQGVILFKGSRLNKLERLVDVFRRSVLNQKDN